MSTDTSDYGLGAVMSQLGPDRAEKTAHETVSTADLHSACASSSELTKLRYIISKGWPRSEGLDPDLLPAKSVINCQ